MANGRNRAPYRVGDSEKVLGEMWVVTERVETLGLDGLRKLEIELGPALPANASVEAEWATRLDHQPGVTVRGKDDPEPTWVVQSIVLAINKDVSAAGLRMTLLDLLTHERERMDKDAHRDALRHAIDWHRDHE